MHGVHEGRGRCIMYAAGWEYYTISDVTGEWGSCAEGVVVTRTMLWLHGR